MGKWMKRWKRTAAVLLSAALLGGCSVREALVTGKNGEKEYGKAETMMIVTTERLRYEELYSEKIWTVAVDNRGTTFEAALLSQIHDFMRELRLMSLMAREENVTLSSREKELAKEATEQYLAALGEDMTKEFDLSTQAVEQFYTDYWTSEKLVEQLTGGMDLEVSDSEAKVISVTQITLDTMEEAQEVLAKVQAEGADFSSAAKEYSKDSEVKKQIYRGMYGEEYEEAAYALTEGEISGIISDSGRYYILKCTDDYDESATRIHKEQMMLEKKNEAFYNVYQSYKEEMTLTGDDALWKELSIIDSPAVSADFFKIYENVCLGQDAGS